MSCAVPVWVMVLRSNASYLENMGCIAVANDGKAIVGKARIGLDRQVRSCARRDCRSSRTPPPVEPRRISSSLFSPSYAGYAAALGPADGLGGCGGAPPRWPCEKLQTSCVRQGDSA